MNVTHPEGGNLQLLLSILFAINSIMELARRFGLLKPQTLPRTESKAECTEIEISRWEQAYLGKSLFRQDVYTTSLALHGENTRKVYALMIADLFHVHIDIPLVDHTPPGRLSQQAYETTFFGEVIPEKYRAFAIDGLSRNGLVAFLNRKTADVSLDEISGWFYTTFGVEHLKNYGSIYIGSHDGRNTDGYDYSATIESSSRQGSVGGVTIESVVNFSRIVRRSLPHLNVEPLPVDAYLQDLQSTLKFLPKDWE